MRSMERPNVEDIARARALIEVSDLEGLGAFLGPLHPADIADVPAGSYTLEYWHEKLGAQTAKVTVPASGSVTADFEYAAK